MLIDEGRACKFISNPVQIEKEWGAISDLYPKTLLVCTFGAIGVDHAKQEIWTQLLYDIMGAGDEDYPVYLRVQKFHHKKIEYFVSSSGDVEGCKFNIWKQYVR